ncbi:MAG: tRNA epoxyqueuosine(34) reductase QueG, partial [Bdellovibrionota bacterium]
HDFVKDKLRQLQSYMHNELALTFDAKIVVDTAPILEKDFAQQAGVGWMGKNTLIMNQKNGSYLYLGLLLTSLDLPEDKPTSAHCGTCTACLDACPTNAFEAPFLLNSAKCISYHTIENKNEDIPAAIQPHLDGWIAGCDICQEVCPWNNKAHVTDSMETQARQHTYLQPDQIDKLARSDHKKIFAQTAFSRIALPKLQQNVKAAMEKDASIKESQKKV